MKCPLCRGKGEIQPSERSVSSATKLKAIKMKQKGMSYRAIAQKLGFKHPGSVVSAIRTYHPSK